MESRDYEREAVPGKQLSYNNILDANSALELLRELKRPFSFCKA